MIVEALKGLIAAGPCTVVLAAFCYALWKKVERLEEKLQTVNDRSLHIVARTQRTVEVLSGIERMPTEVDRVIDEEYDRRGEDRPRLGRKEDL